MKTKKHKRFRNKTSKIYAIPSCDKDIKGIIDINAVRNKDGTGARASEFIFFSGACNI